jgi:hypothetical protein
MLLVLKTKKQDKHLLMATATKVLIFPRSPMGIDFLPKSLGKNFPHRSVGKTPHRRPLEMYTFYNPATRAAHRLPLLDRLFRLLKLEVNLLGF